LTIHAGDTQATATVALTDDIYHEDPETFAVRLNNPSTGAEIDRDNDTATGIILPADDPPVVTEEGANADEWIRVREDAGTLEIRVTLNKPGDREIQVDYSGTFVLPQQAVHTYPRSRGRGCSSPFELTPGTLVFEPGAVAASIQVTIVNDNERCASAYSDLDERRFEVRLSNASNAVFPGRGSTFVATVSVIDVAIGPCVAVAGPDEIPESAGTATFRVVLSRTADTDIEVTLETRARDADRFARATDRGEATAGDDYTALPRTTVKVPRGSLEVQVPVAIIDDEIVESTEGFRVWVLETGTGSVGWCNTWHRATSSNAWIIDDDTLPTMTVADVDVLESAGAAFFTVSLDRVAGRDVTVAYSTTDGTAVAPDDYTAAAGTLTIDAGTLAGTITIDISDDDDDEEDAETFTLQLSDPSGADISDDDDEATATIRDDDTSDLLVVSIAGTVVAEGVPASLVITFSEPVPGPCLSDLDLQTWEPTGDTVAVSYTLVAVPSLGAQAATPGSRPSQRPGLGPAVEATADFYQKTGSLHFLPCQTGAGLLVSLTPRDGVPELDERFLVVLHGPVNATIGNGRAWVTITDDDVPLVSVADVSASEGAGSVVFTVDLHAPGVYDASVRYRTLVQGSAGDAAATPDEDYADISGTLDIPAGTGSATITVPVAGDGTDEPDETFILELYEPELLTLKKASAIGTITDDDPGY
ncbi:MAG: hypothetical protein OXC00_04420, partial [Acidimicrobiaceae bacterium]|nr:hypothetical protein [Acidimicrobiaceae bacterium]